MKKTGIRITKKQVKIIYVISTAAFWGLAFWADWRIGLAFIALGISNFFDNFCKRGKND
ncbi:MAG: hypothetical protein LBJ41_01790 [Treponema sp.]|jgi:hypothetical protein|nr:hypothetical protein [Treponema sp.]